MVSGGGGESSRTASLLCNCLFLCDGLEIQIKLRDKISRVDKQDFRKTHFFLSTEFNIRLLRFDFFHLSNILINVFAGQFSMVTGRLLNKRKKEMSNSVLMKNTSLRQFSCTFST